MVGQPLASAMASVAKGERELGVLAVNLGAGTTGCTVYERSALRFSRVLPVGGNHVTSDLAAAWGIAFDESERLKLELPEIAASNADSVEAHSPSGEEIRLSLRRGMSVMRARVEETFDIIRREIGRQGFDQVPASVVLSGQGALLQRVAARAAEVFGIPCRAVTSYGATGIHGAPEGPGWATVVGLVLYGAEVDKQGVPVGPDAPWIRRQANTFWNWLMDF
jgi:cell division protein FtsA